MLSSAINFLILSISRVCHFINVIKINDDPTIYLGEFLIACLFIGVVLRFLFGTDFFPTATDVRALAWKNLKSNNKANYEPKHAKKKVKE